MMSKVERGDGNGGFVADLKPSEIFMLRVQPALDEYAKDPLSERLANSVARALDHHLDWTFEYYKARNPSRLKGADLRTFRRALLSHHPELRMMNDLSDADHHRFLNWPADPPRVVDTSTAAYSVQSGELYVPKYQATFPSAAAKAADIWRNWKD